MTLAKYHTLDIPVLMAIIAIIITLCQDDDVDDDGMVCRTHRAQRGEISGAKTEPAVPYNTHLPLCGCVVCPYPDFTTISYLALSLYIYGLLRYATLMPLLPLDGVARSIRWIATVNYHL